MENNTILKNAGFWIRLLATWFDFLIIYLFQKTIFYLFLLLHIYVYLPQELTFIIIFFIYSSISIAWKGQTLGKWFLNLKVINRKDEKPLIFLIVLRESILKVLSGLVLFLGFMWIGFTRQKKGWHDIICRTQVIHLQFGDLKTGIFKIVGIASFGILFSLYVWDISSTIYKVQQMKQNQTFTDLPFVIRDSTFVKDVSTITNDSLYVAWLDKNALSPEEYFIKTTSQHLVTLVGERHETFEYLEFINKMIPDLYFKSGIRCIGMETITSDMNSKINVLINSKEYNNDLALEISRSQPWKLWGFKGYWDILESVWKLNKSLPDTCQKMRIVGIDEDWDGPNFIMALSTIKNSDDAIKNVPKYNILKFLTSIPDLVKCIYREELMAYNVEQEIFNKNQKAIIIIGANHTFLNCGYPRKKDKKVVFVKARMGLLLMQKYPNLLNQFVFWSSTSSDSIHCPLVTFIERIMQQRNFEPVGFSIVNSPFGLLRDNKSYIIKEYRTIAYEDLYWGLLFFKPENKLKKCEWTKNYISNEMFLEYKQFYCLRIKTQFSNASDVNTFFENQSIIHNKGK